MSLEDLTAEFFLRMTPTTDPPPFSTFDKYEKGDVTMSRLVCESLLTPGFYDKIFVRYGHLPDFKKLPGLCLLLMALETCNASVFHDIDGAAQVFADLSLDSYPGENVADLSNEALRLIRIMKGGYALPVSTGSRLLQKVARTSCEEFNHAIYTLLDTVKRMERKYKAVDPRKLLNDPSYDKLGPIGLINTLHEMYGHLITDHDWPALATKLPQSNNATTTQHSSAKTSNKSDIKCFRCKGNHHVKDCPKKTKNKDREADKDANHDAEPTGKKAKTALPAWHCVEPKDLSSALVDNNGKHWKFCTKCICKQSGTQGLYLLSHFDSEHKDDYTRPTPVNESSLASVEVPMGIPVATTHDPTTAPFDDDHPIEFQGAWCAAVSIADATAAFSDVSFAADDSDEDAEDATSDDEEADSSSAASIVLMFPDPDLDSDFDLDYSDSLSTTDSSSDDCDAIIGPALALPVSVNAFDRALESLAHLSSVEREMFLQVKHDLFPGSATQDIFVSPVSSVVERESFVSATQDTLDRNAVASVVPVVSPVLSVLERESFVFDSSLAPFSDGHQHSSVVLPLPSVTSMIATWLFPSPVPRQPLVDLTWMMNWFCQPVSTTVLTCLLSVLSVAFDWVLRSSPVAFGIFSGTLLVWEGMLSLNQVFTQPSPGLPRRERHRLDKLTWYQRHNRSGRRLPLLVMLPAMWMALTHVITVPFGSNTTHFLGFLPFYTCFFGSIFHRVAHLDQMMTLDSSVWCQICNAKATYLFQALAPPLCDADLLSLRPVVIKAIPSLFSLSVDDCWVSAGKTLRPCVYGPSSFDLSHTSVCMQSSEEQLSSVDDPSVFMVFRTQLPQRQPAIFDTGASLAISPEKADFDGPLTIPKGDLRLGGMANGLKIEGLGSITWTFSNGAGDDVVVRGMANYVPKAKARLLSPQRLFDTSTGTQGRYEGDQQSFRLYLDGSSPLVVEYDDCNALPIAYATIGPVPSMIRDPQLNLSILSDENQNLTGAQKLLLQWHYRFGHLNMPSVQRLFRATPFLSAKFSASSKCAIDGMRCDISEFAKAHRRPKHHATVTPNDVCDGALKANHLKPGVQV